MSTLFPLRASLALLAVATVAACGGGGNGASPVTSTISSVSASTSTIISGSTVPPTAVSISGKVMNVGYLGNTVVCVDLNDDGVCSGSEPQVTTDATGAYRLSAPSGSRGATLIAQVRPDSTDSASTTAAPITFGQGWVLANLLEYEDDASSASINISPVTATYYARVRLQGRNRLANQIAMFTRVVFETNIDSTTGKMLLPVDFDYIANPRNTLSARIGALTTVLSTRASAAGAPLGLLASSGVMAGWYNTYTAPTASAAGAPVAASKIATLTTTSTPEYYVANDFRYFRPHTDAALQMRSGVTDTAGWIRTNKAGSLSTLDRRSLTLSNGTILTKLARWASSLWGDITVDEGGYYTLNPSSTALVLNTGTDYLLPKIISTADGNRVSSYLPNSNARLQFDIASSPGTNFMVEEWLTEQRDYTAYYNGSAPTTAPLSSAPSACNKHYAGAPQQGSNTNATTGAGTGTTASAWFATCYDYYDAEYYDKVLGDVALTGVNAAIPGATFHDTWISKPIVVAPLTSSCGTTATPMATVVVLGQTHCNWAVNANSGHTLADLFASGGVAINSWTKTYGTLTGVGTAGTTAQAGLPQQLTLTLNRSGSATSGSGTLTSPYGAWTSTSTTATTETIEWEMDSKNPNMVLLRWPFRDINDPRVKTNTKSDGSAVVTAPVLPAGHFTASWNGNTFSAAPSTHTAPNYQRLAIVLQSGVFVVGQYYGAGYTYTERRFTQDAMALGMTALNYVLAKLYAVGFVDQ